MHKTSYYVINAITFYRIIAAPLLVYLIFTGNINLFKWLLPVSFFTDLIDGFLARKFNVASILGSRLDSLGDDMTIVAAIIGAFVFKKEFMNANLEVVFVMIGLLVIQNIIALIKYRKTTSFHTYLAKISAVFQGFFLILMFLLPEPIYFLFYAAAIFTILDLLEEIIMVIIIPKWKANIKGIYWVLKKTKIED